MWLANLPDVQLFPENNDSIFFLSFVFLPGTFQNFFKFQPQSLPYPRSLPSLASLPHSRTLKSSEQYLGRSTKSQSASRHTSPARSCWERLLGSNKFRRYPCPLESQWHQATCRGDPCSHLSSPFPRVDSPGAFSFLDIKCYSFWKFQS